MAQKWHVSVYNHYRYDHYNSLNQNKTRVALGQDVKLSVPKACQIDKGKPESLTVKGVSAEVTGEDFKDSST